MELVSLPDGAVVLSSIRTNGAALKSGLSPGDQVLAINGNPIKNQSVGLCHEISVWTTFGFWPRHMMPSNTMTRELIFSLFVLVCDN